MKNIQKMSDIDSAILDALLLNIAIIDEDGAIVAVNKAWRDFAEANHPEPASVCEGANYLAVCDAAEGPDGAMAAEFAAALRAMLGGERDGFGLEYPCHSPEAQRWFSAHATLMPAGAARRAIVVHELITERKLAELELRVSEKRYRELFENSLIAISETDAEGRLVRGNQAYARLYGYESPEVMAREIRDIGLQLYADPEDRREVFRILEEKDCMEPREMRVKRRDGSPFHVLVSAKVLRDEGGELLGYQAVHVDISERRRAEDELRASREQMRVLSSRAQAALENERTSAARKIHDLLSQTLTRLKIDLVWLQRRIENPGETLSAKKLGPRVAEMIGMADEAVDTVQRIATELRPAVLDSLGLGAALVWLARDFQKHSEIACRAYVPEGEPRIDRDAATAAFRIAQESLANVARHSRATEAGILLSQEAEQLVLIIHDNGIGFEAEKLKDPFSVGLAGMRERALLLGGTLNIRSGSASGSTVEARLPLSRPGGRGGSMR
jgi:two-component system, NarL family, sensor histidine kinase UhpB